MLRSTGPDFQLHDDSLESEWGREAKDNAVTFWLIPSNPVWLSHYSPMRKQDTFLFFLNRL